MHRSTLAWLTLLGLALASLGICTMRLERLPAFPALVGPDMTVRETKVPSDSNVKTPLLAREDKLVAIESRDVDDLRDLRSVLANLDFSQAKQQENGTRTLDVTYQVVRPLYRFNVLLQGDALKPDELPAGVQPTDLLVELDGRPMQPPIGPEGLRSIISSRPEAFLVFERQNEVFSGKQTLTEPHFPQVVLLLFGLALLMLLALWRTHHDSLPWVTSLAVGIETLAFSWLGLVMFQYQWVLADYILAYVTIFAMIAMRPLGIVARTAVAEGLDPRTWGSVLLGIVAAGTICFLLSQGTIPNAELALQLGAIVAGFFVLFEVILTGLNEESGKLLGERSIYLAGILLCVFFACLLSWIMDESAFVEDRWRWFACLVLALVWFGDVLLCLRGIPDNQFGELADVQTRQFIIWSYLEEMQSIYPGLDTSLLLLRGDSSTLLTRDGDTIVANAAPEGMHDAIFILVQEGARVPGSALMDEHEDPMSGIAEAMNIELAFSMSAPRQSIDAPDGALVFLATGQTVDEPLQIELGDEDLDFIQSRMTALIWSATIIESLSCVKAPRAVMPSAVAAAASPKEPTDEHVAELKTAQGRVALLEEDAAHLSEHLSQMKTWFRPLAGVPDGERLLEPELLESMAYLFESPGPIVLSGAYGVGKKFVARVAHNLDDQRAAAACILYDASLYEDVDYLVHFEHQNPSPIMVVSSGGSLVVDHAQLLDERAMRALIEQAEDAQVQLYLCFVAADAESRSAFDSYDEELAVALESREIVIPSFMNRPSIHRHVLLHLLDLSAFLHQKSTENISPVAMNALLSYDYPGQLPEARAIVDIAVRRSAGHLIEINALPLQVRRPQSY